MAAMFAIPMDMHRMLLGPSGRLRGNNVLKAVAERLGNEFVKAATPATNPSKGWQAKTWPRPARRC